MSTPVSPSVANPGVPAPSTGPAPHPRATPEARGLALGLLGVTIFALTLPMTRLAVGTPEAPLMSGLFIAMGRAAVAGLLSALLLLALRAPWPRRADLPALAVTALGVVVGFPLLTALALWRVEARLRLPAGPASEAGTVGLRQALAEVWAEPAARRFTVFVFLSMTAYFMQELILEPYAGLVFGFTPGQSTSLGGAQNGGVFLGMVLVGVAATGLGLGSLRTWVAAGCLGSAAALCLIATLGQTGPVVPLAAAVAGLGLFNGIFAVAAIGSMMALAGQGRSGREGTRMGLWGAAQAIAAGFGGLAGAAGADLLRRLLADDAAGFGAVFLIEAALFLVAAHLAQQAIAAGPAPRRLVPGE